MIYRFKGEQVGSSQVDLQVDHVLLSVGFKQHLMGLDHQHNVLLGLVHEASCVEVIPSR